MFKNIIRLIITSSLTVFLIASNALAFHKDGKSLIQENVKEAFSQNIALSKFNLIKL